MNAPNGPSDDPPFMDRPSQDRIEPAGPGAPEQDVRHRFPLTWRRDSTDTESAISTTCPPARPNGLKHRTRRGARRSLARRMGSTAGAL